MAARGTISADSVAGRVLAIVAEAGARPASRCAIRQKLQPRQRDGLHIALDRLLNNGAIIQIAGGYVTAASEPLVVAPAFDQAMPEPLTEPLRLHLAAIRRRAHALTQAGQRASAVLLLSSAARHPALPPHVGADLGVLAALFRHHRPEGAGA